MRKVFLSFAVFTLAVIGVGLVSPSAEAACATPGTVSNSGYTVGGIAYQYLNFPGNTTGGFIGRFWQTNSPTLNNEGTFNVGAAMFNVGADNWAFAFDLSNAAVVGCPGGCLTTYIEDPQSGRAILWTSAGNSFAYNSLVFNYTYDQYGTVVAPQGPRPRATSSSRAVNTVTVNFDIPDVGPNVRTESGTCASGDGAVTARRAYIQQAASAPSTNIAGWTQLGTDATLTGPAAGRSNGFDCTNTALDWWLATGIVVNGQAPRFVSSPVQIECDPNLADPHGGFKKIDRPTTPKTQGRD